MVRFFHLADKPFTEWRESGGRVIPRIAKPSGFWVARDLAWVGLMDKAGQWTPRPDKEVPGDEPPGRIRAAVSHALAGTPVPAPAEGEEIRPLRWSPLFVYELTVPDTAFTPDLSSPDRSRILQVSRGTLDALMAAYDAFAREWITTEGPSHPIVQDVLRAALTKTVDSKPEDLARTKQIRELVKKTKAPIYEILASKDAVRTILTEGLTGTVVLPRQREIKVAIWQAFVARLRTQWGGIEFLDDLFTSEGDDPALVARVELLRRLDVPSAILFSVPSLLGPAPPQTYLRAVLVGGTAAVDVPAGVPVYRFGTTPAGELRVLPSSGGRRRRTRRRVLKNPKTLKKRIR